MSALMTKKAALLAEYDKELEDNRIEKGELLKRIKGLEKDLSLTDNMLTQKKLSEDDINSKVSEMQRRLGESTGQLCEANNRIAILQNEYKELHKKHNLL